MSAFIFVLASLATFRLSIMFAKENGPGRIFKKARAATPLKSALREGIECALCESVWWSAVVTTSLYFYGEVPLKIAPIYWLAASAVAVVLNQRFTKDL